MEIQVENAGLTPEEFGAVISAKVEHQTAATGERGLGADVLTAVVTTAGSATVTTIIEGVWQAWTRRRERDLRDARTVTVVVRTSGDHADREAVLELTGDGRDAISEIESELSQDATETVHRLRITFPG